MDSPQTQAPAKARKWIVLGIVTALAAVVGLAHWLRVRNLEEAVDAFVDAHVAPISSKVSGQVTAVHVDDNQTVKAGDPLVDIDPADYRVAAARARSELAAAQAAARQAETDARRYAQLVAKDQVSRQAADKTSAEAEVARAKVDAAREALAQAELNLSYTKIAAPQAGRVARRSVELQSWVQPGQALMAVVPEDVYVIANFKETQLRRMRPGQEARVRVDAYPDHEFKAHVDSLQAGTGARFSLLPPENATGNFVKVVQRVPVKIVFDEPTQGKLAPGMSVVPTVKVD